MQWWVLMTCPLPVSWTLDILKNLNKLLTDTRLALAMANDYRKIYSIDTSDGSYLEYERDSTDNDFSVSSKGTDFFSDCAEFCSSAVYIDDQPLLQDMFTRETFMKRISSGDHFNFDYRFMIGGVPVYHRMKTIIGKDENAGTVFIGITDIDRQKKRELEIKAELFKDSLTGVKNKSAYNDTEKKLDALIREGICEEFSIFVFDLNDLKKVNDSLGHDEDDRYIRSGCLLICSTFKHSPVFRIGGDEFAAVLKDSDYNERRELKKALKEKVEANLQSSGVIIAVGSADFSPETDTCLLDVFKRADREMYSDKRRLKGI